MLISSTVSCLIFITLFLTDCSIPRNQSIPIKTSHGNTESLKYGSKFVMLSHELVFKTYPCKSISNPFLVGCQEEGHVISPLQVKMMSCDSM